MLKRFHLWLWRTTELFGNLTKDLRFQHSLRARYTLRRPRRSNCRRSNLAIIHHTPALFLKTLFWKKDFLGGKINVQALADKLYYTSIVAMPWMLRATFHQLPGAQVESILVSQSGVRRLWLSSWHLVAAGLSGNHSREWWWEPGPLLSSSIFSVSRRRVSHWATSVSLQTN